MSTPHFHTLTVSDIRALTADSITVALAVPQALREAYRFTQGQFLTLKAEIADEELRRAYSICCSVQDYEATGTLRVGIKRVAGGRFSNFIADHLRIGQPLDVMTPDGRFFTALDAAQTKRYVGFAGGSGITPFLSLISTTLAREPGSHFTLVYGNRTVPAIMFAEELEDLKNQYLQRLTLIHVLSDEAQESELFSGLLDQAKCAELLRSVVPAATIDDAFICGPGPMMDAAEAALLQAGLNARHIHIERFGTFVPPAARIEIADTTPAADLTVIMDGKERRARVAYPEGDQVLDTVLDAGLRTGAPLPFSCKAGNCSTCRAKVMEGTVRMLKNFALNPDEVAQGFVLTCQCVPTSDRIVVSFDER